MDLSVDRIREPWGPRTPYGPPDNMDEVLADPLSAPKIWPSRTDSRIPGVPEDQVDRWVHSACVLCSTGCGLEIAVKDGRMAGVRGREIDSVNRGRLGPKCLFGSVPPANSPDRLTRPLIRRDGTLEETDWETAMSAIVERSRRQIEQRTAGSIGFYVTGQIFIEEYYTLGVIGKAGLGTPHMDGNTRLCTATAAAALKESFGSDGQPGSYDDFDTCDAIFHWGHNIAEQNTVLWMRILDRRAGPRPPQLVVVDPRATPAARAADLHLAPRSGTNMALLNAIQHELIANGWIDEEFIAAHTLHFQKLEEMVRSYTPERAARICGIDAGQIRDAARIFGTSERVVSTVLQGFYQSWQATASSCQVNNLHLLRGLIGRPGCTVLQMNGQPTAQNTRETGADGDLPGFRNWNNPEHIRQLAELWNVEENMIPHWSPPTHAMQIWRYAEQGSIGLLWIVATNPAVSLPELHRIREILKKPDLFVVVQDIFLTETGQLADVVLPAAMWGEKTGTYTNVDRSVHLSDKAVEPPGDARADLDIFLDYARRMDFRDKDGQPLIKWDTPEAAYRAWQACSRGRPCDYSRLTYDLLRERGTVQWPVNEEHPEGTPRLYTDFRFPTDPEYSETYTQDLITGAALPPVHYKAMNPGARALLREAPYIPPPELPDEQYPLLMTTGRTVYQFHTRTKTARGRQLHEAAPDVWVELSQEDAAGLDLHEGDLAQVESRRGSVQAAVRITGIREGCIFIPFHYGYWDEPEGHSPDGRPRAANELTMTEWDPVSKQPAFKIGTARIKLLRRGEGRPSPAPSVSAPPLDPAISTDAGVSDAQARSVEHEEG